MLEGGTIIRGIGVGLSFLRFVIHGDPSKKILKELNKAENITQYLEWLRRKSHQELKDEIQEVQDSTGQLLTQAHQLGIDLETLSSQVTANSEGLREELNLLQ